MDQDEGEGISEIPNPNPVQGGEVGAVEVVGSRFLDSPSLMDPVYGGEDGGRGSEAEEVVGGDAAEKVEPSVGDALEDGKSLVDVWEEEMGPLVDVVAEKEVRPLVDGQVESGCAAVVEEVGSSVPALDAAEETEPLLGDSTEVAVEPIENDLEKGAMEPLEDDLVEERMEPLLDAVGEDKGEPLVDAGMEDEVEPLVGAVVEESESLAVAVQDDEDVQPLVNTTAEKVVEPLVNALVEEDEPLVNDVVVEGTEVLAEGTKPAVDTMEEEAAEPLLNAVEEEEAEPLLDAVEGEAPVPLLDAVEEEVTVPLLDAVEEKIANPLLDVEEKAVEPLVDSKVEEPAENLMDSRAEEATEHLRDSVAEEAAEPLMDSRLEEAATTLDHSMVEEDAEPLADNMVEEDAEPLADNMVEEDAEPLADNMVEEDAEPLADNMVEEDAGPLADNMVEEDAEPLADNMAEEDAEPLADNMVGEDVEPLADNMVEEDVDISTVSAKKSVGKRKRGRPPKTQQTRTLSKRKMEEDVCFICFDGGNLVVCDRRGCPKVYHPACVNRDDAFFRSKGRWNCGLLVGFEGKLSLTLEELTGAKTPRKESNVTVGNDESSEELYDANVDQVGSSDSSSERRGISNSSRKKLKKGSRVILKEEGPTRAPREDSHPDEIDWASNELLEFVAHMKGGDRSLLSQFDVQALLLEYIKRNNLRDPRRKSQIICDARLQSLFGKPRVGHFEMLKLLESHFLMKEVAQPVTDESQGGVVDPDSSPVDADGNSDASTRLSFDKRRKTRKRSDEKEPQTNLDDYAAIDVHNINLMYLRRNLMEDLIDDTEFSEKVIGCFVRIRISGASQKQDMYRLVQVVGTRMALEKYKTGKKMTDIMLEILNLDKTEVVTVDVISNQDFTEEECKRLRQSIKCGLISRLTVGDIQEKARALQAVRVNDWLENEKSRLGHLRGSYESEKLLNTPEERMKRLNDVPEIHSDPHMDPDYESAEEEPDDKKRDNYKSRESSSLRKAREAGFLGKGGSSSSTWNERKSSETNSEVGSRDRVDSQRKDVSQLNVQSAAIDLETGSRNNNQLGKKPGQSSDIPSDTVLGSLSSGVAPQPIVNETEKIWHYKDPSGKIQGPFSMAQLRKWSTTGYFPQNLRIWRISDKQDNSILLADAMNGKFLKDLSSHDPQHSSFSQSARVTSVTENRGATGNFERTIADKWPSQPPMWSAPIRKLQIPLI
ncbi:hypothetical protein J5N97_025391 [Dioscorea zingiberensis]|uniref:Zinc finger CCCH domain-containing protein 19 n=1 Tax=Dioscorea zingiberensis TaxID=325984 RepID=A0A9D5C982_9LILI|nr:hypothetical protein J5N97_025391 [Dioscorea zingiberensis]